jgi:hypothetical protein
MRFPIQPRARVTLRGVCGGGRFTNDEPAEGLHLRVVGAGRSMVLFRSIGVVTYSTKWAAAVNMARKILPEQAVMEDCDVETVVQMRTPHNADERSQGVFYEKAREPIITWHRGQYCLALPGARSRL